MDLKDYFVYDDIVSSDHNVYASGEATFDAPEKEYDTYEIPGRSGDLQIFRGRYKNVKVEYPCVYEKAFQDFVKDITELRNALLACNGYRKLYDSHNPDEYRMAIYRGGLDINPTDRRNATTFNIEFDCKPQRYLTSGDVPITVASGDHIINPTLFSSSPLLAVQGYGKIAINESEITVQNLPIGRIKLSGAASNATSATLTTQYITSLYNQGDDANVTAWWKVTFHISEAVTGTITVQQLTVAYGLNIFMLLVDSRTGEITVNINAPNAPFDAGVSTSWERIVLVKVSYVDSQTLDETYANVSVKVRMEFASTSVSISLVSVSTTNEEATITQVKQRKEFESGYVSSTKSTLGDPLYIDLENGEAYKYENNQYMLVNYGVSIGTYLPVLKPGTNTITKDNTITELIITPRWWQL